MESLITEIERRENPVGYRSTPEGIEPVNAPFWVLLANDDPDKPPRQVGYLWKEDYNITFTRSFPPNDVGRICELVESEFGVTVGQVGQPPVEEQPNKEEDEEDES